jgi:hypothetical protein
LKGPYLVSIDLETAATSEDRELGIKLQAPQMDARLRDQFRADWAASSTLASIVGGVGPAGSS